MRPPGRVPEARCRLRDPDPEIPGEPLAGGLPVAGLLSPSFFRTFAGSTNA